MVGHVRGCARGQTVLLARCLDDEVPAGHWVRVLDAYVASVDLRALGFRRAVAAASVGRPSYDPAGLAKLLLYGYLDGARSSRRLARECERNVEVRWLLEAVRPCFKTIASFRREHHAALVGLSREFVRFCRAHDLLAAALVAVDGSKFEAASGVRAVYDEARIARELALVEARAAAYLDGLAAADAAEDAASASLAAGSAADELARRGRVAAALKRLAARRERLQSMSAGLKQSGASRCVAGDDARVMKKRGGGRVVGYNVQAAVDAKHKLVAHCEVTTAANDHGQLYPQARRAQAAVGAARLTVVADAGYKNAAQSQACEAAGIAVVVPAHRVVNPRGRGRRFTRDAFTYDAGRDQYTCPGGAALTRRGVDAKRLRVYQAAASACRGCALKAQCTPAERRTVKRHIHADALARANRRAAERPELLRRRAALVEHPFGNIKRMMGGGRFLMRGLAHVQAEMSLSVLAYNLRRATNLLGVERLCAMLAAPAAVAASAALSPRPAAPT